MHNYVLPFGRGFASRPARTKVPRTWPQAYSVQRDEASGILTLRTPYYTVEQDLKKGGAITRITLTHGKAANLLVRPMETRVRDESGTVLTDLNDSAPTVTHRREGLNEIVTVESALKDQSGGASGLRVKTTLPVSLGIRQDPQGVACSGRRSACGRFARCPPSLPRASPTTVIGKGSRRRKRLHRFRLGATAGGSCVWDIPRTRPSRRATCRVP